jgi:Ca2+-dependent lipid-binding protein
MPTKTAPKDQLHSAVHVVLVVKEAHGLAAADRNGSSDPYCIVTCKAIVTRRA